MLWNQSIGAANYHRVQVHCILIAILIFSLYNVAPTSRLLKLWDNNFLELFVKIENLPCMAGITREEALARSLEEQFTLKGDNNSVDYYMQPLKRKLQTSGSSNFFVKTNERKRVEKIMSHYSSSVSSLIIVPIYGGIESLGYYYSNIFIGIPPQTQSVIVDTGSYLLGFPCTLCAACGKYHMNKFYDVDASRTADWLLCSDPKCVSRECTTITNEFLRAPTCSYVQTYSEGSLLKGAYFKDVLSFAGKKNQTMSKSFQYDYIGCHTKETYLFVTQIANGIMGLAGSKSSPNQSIVTSMKKAGHIKHQVFSMCLSNEGGRLALGGYTTKFHTKPEALLRKLFNYDSPSNGRLNSSRKIEWEAATKRLKPSERMFGTRNAMQIQKSGVYNHIKNTTRWQNSFKKKAAYSKTRRRKLQNSNRNKATALHSSGDTDVSSNSIVWTSLISDYNYQIKVSELRLYIPGRENTNSVILGLYNDLGPSLIDSGTTYTYFPQIVFEKINQLFENFCKNVLPCFMEMDRSGTYRCWNISEVEKSFAQFPVFELRVNDNDSIYWFPKSYLSRYNKTLDDTWCLAIDSHVKSQTVLGTSFMMYHDIIFDKESETIGFAPADCPAVQEADSIEDEALQDKMDDYSNYHTDEGQVQQMLESRGDPTSSEDWGLHKSNMVIIDDEHQLVEYFSISGLLAGSGVFLGLVFLWLSILILRKLLPARLTRPKISLVIDSL